jgi:hypothetical protein
MSFQFAMCAPAEVVKHAYWIYQQLLISGSACRTARNGVTRHAHMARNLQRPITTFVSRSRTSRPCYRRETRNHKCQTSNVDDRRG